MPSIKYHIVKYVSIFGAIGVALTALYMIFTHVPNAHTQIGVKAVDGYGAEAKAAMSIINGYAGCRILVPGDSILVKSEDGEPCGDPWRPAGEEGHDATAYRCGDRKFEILISSPGDVHQQACIIAHELGHVLGLPHAKRGIMSNTCPKKISLSGDEVENLKERFCQ